MLWALTALHGNVGMLSIAGVVYALGLRHAVDADHIAAIDNVTRKLMQQGQQPVAVGFSFALGHSTIVLVVTAAIAGAAQLFGSFREFREIGGVISTSISASFLLAVAAVNISIYSGLRSTYRRLKAGEVITPDDLDLLLDGRGLLARLLRPLFGIVSRSWHMIALGFLFGLGFDTATEVAMFGMSAGQIGQGVSFGLVLIFPVLFAAGMMLIDTSDGILMLGLYEWAFVNPVRKIRYNMVITLASILVAVSIAVVEALNLACTCLGLQGAFATGMNFLNEHFNELGLAVVATFVGAWMVSWLIHKIRGVEAFGGPAQA